MIVTNELLLAEFRTPGACEWCKKPCSLREPAHIFSRGAGQVDIRCNLVALGSTPSFSCECHRRSHDGFSPLRIDLLAIAAGREGVLQHEISGVVAWFRRQPKWLTLEQLHAQGERELDGGTRLLLFRCLEEPGAVYGTPQVTRGSKQIR